MHDITGLYGRSALHRVVGWRSGVLVPAIVSVLLGACTAQLGRNTAGEYQFPAYHTTAEPDRGLTFRERLGAPIIVGAEWFSDLPPAQLLTRLEWVCFYDNGYPEWLRRGRLAGPYSFGIDRRFRYSRYGPKWGDDTVYGSDGEGDELMAAMFESLIHGIQKGTWRLDPHLTKATKDDMAIHDVTPLCRMTVRLAQGSDYEAAEEYPPTTNEFWSIGEIYIAVYYSYEIIATEQGEEPGDVIPHVFLFGNRTSSHVFMLDQTHGKELHSTAIKLYQRVLVLGEERNSPD